MPPKPPSCGLLGCSGGGLGSGSGSGTGSGSATGSGCPAGCPPPGGQNGQTAGGQPQGPNAHLGPQLSWNAFTPRDGNAFRRVEDLALNFGVGEHRLGFVRYHNSGATSAALDVFGNGGAWRHNYQWDLNAAAPDVSGFTPEGASMEFYSQALQDAIYTLEGLIQQEVISGYDEEDIYHEAYAAAGWVDSQGRTNITFGEPLIAYSRRPGADLINWGVTNFALVHDSGWRHEFEQRPHANWAIEDHLVLVRFIDPHGVTYEVEGDASNRVKKITDPTGRWLELTYANDRLSRVDASDGRFVTYNYDQHVVSSVTYHLLDDVDYQDGTRASYQYYENAPFRLAIMEDSKLSGPAALVQYIYGTSGIHKEINPVTGKTFAEITGFEHNGINDYVVHSVDQYGGTNSYTVIEESVGSATDAIVSSVSQADGSTRSFGPNYVEDELGRRLYSIRNAKESLVRRYLQKNGILWSEGWKRNADEFVTAYTNRHGNITDYVRDTNNRVVAVSHPDGSTEGFDYNTLGQMTFYTNQLEQVTSYHYDSSNRISAVVDVAGYTNSYTYDAYDRVKTHTDGRGNTTIYGYDSRGNRNLITFADTSTQGFAYNDHGQLLFATNELGQLVESKTYNEYGQLMTDTDRYGRTTIYDYNLAPGSGGCCGSAGQNGQPVQITAPSGKVTAFEYDYRGRRTAVINSWGTADASTNSFMFEVVGRMTNRVDAFGEEWGTEYDLEDRLTKQIDPLGQATLADYAVVANELYITNTTPAGHVTVVVQDTMGRIRRTTHPDTATEIRAYTPNGRIQSLTGTAVHGVRYEYGFDAKGWFTKAIRLKKDGSDSAEWSKSYEDAVGNPVRTEFADGAYGIAEFDNRDRLTKAVDPDGVTSLTIYNIAGEVAFSAVDINTNGVVDLAGTDRVIYRTNFVDSATLLPGGGQAIVNETYVWPTNWVDAAILADRSEVSLDGLESANSSFGRTNLVQNSLCSSCGATTNTAFDGSYTITVKEKGRVDSVTRYDARDVQLSSQDFTYDELGRRKTIVDARTGTTTHHYDDVLAWTSVTLPSPGAGQPPQTTTTYTDGRGRATRVIQSDGTSVTNRYHPTGELKQTSGSRTYPVEYTHDYAGRMETMTTWQDFAGDTGKAVTTWTYDSQRGWLDRKQYDDGNGPEYTYYASGKLRTRSWERGITTTYLYSNGGQLASTDYSDATADLTYTYDRQGRQSTIVQGSVTTTKTYTDSGRLHTESYSGGPLNGITITNSYDTLLRRETLAAIKPSSFDLETSFSYDDASRLSAVSDGISTATYSYLANSALVEQIEFNRSGAANMITTKSYDLINRLIGITHVDSQPATLASFHYGYNSANQRTNVTQSDNSYWHFEYDDLGQVTDGTKHDGQGIPLTGYDFGYAYDDIGNRTSVDDNGTVETYNANLLNQYINIAGVTSSHDADGNTEADDDWIYTWNGENRLTVLESSINIPAAERKKLEFSYDHQGRRVSKNVYTWNTGNSAYDLTSQSIFAYDGWNLLAVLDGNQNPHTSFNWGLDLSGSEQGAGGVGGLLMATSHGDSTTHFVAHDGNGNVTRLVDSVLGTVTASYEYSPFGRRISATGSMALVNPFRFSTKFEDNESGFNYYGFRFYNSVYGRWMNRDPIEEYGGLNIFVFTWNSPLIFVDIDGRSGWGAPFFPPLGPPSPPGGMPCFHQCMNMMTGGLWVGLFGASLSVSAAALDAWILRTNGSIVTGHLARLVASGILSPAQAAAIMKGSGAVVGSAFGTVAACLSAWVVGVAGGCAASCF